MSKIFCIGSNKTGTTSLTSLAKTLGLKALPEDVTYKYINAGDSSKTSKRKLHRLMNDHRNDYNFFEDLPFNFRSNYKSLLKTERESIFILTTRNPEAWFNSCLNWISKRNCKSIYDWIWSDDFVAENKHRILKKYKRRNQLINIYFHSKRMEKRLLTVQLEDPDPMKIAYFLNRKLQAEKIELTGKLKYPWANKSNE